MKISHVTLTTPFQRRFVTRKLESDTIYLYAKFNNSDFSRSRDVIGPQNLKWVT